MIKIAWGRKDLFGSNIPCHCSLKEEKAETQAGQELVGRSFYGLFLPGLVLKSLSVCFLIELRVNKSGVDTTHYGMNLFTVVTSYETSQ